ncbi:MAG: hypothetical protein R3249_12095 [Nitriliruptorales bacterium]|nr:hypothetical protein [Nitriliruptorales bacterium]
MSPTRPRLGARLRAAAVTTLAALLASACNLAIGVDVTIGADGSGRLELAFRLDEELTSSLEADGFDPTFGVDALADAGSDWSVDVDRGDALTVRVSAPFADQVELDDRIQELNAGIDVTEDGSVLDALEVEVLADGRVRVTGAATLVIPASTGAEGDGVVFDGDDLRALIDESGDEVFLAEFRLRMPGPVEATDADVVDGNLAVWRLPIDQTRQFTAEATPSDDRTLLLGAAIGLVALAAGILLGTRRRR